MLKEISLHILDLVENAIRAHASYIEIKIAVDTKINSLTVTIEDNGDGMTPEQLENATEPFFTTKETGTGGFGIPLMKQEAQATGGRFFNNFYLW